jgi:hypothetical protein
MSFVRIDGHIVNTDHIAAIRLGNRTSAAAIMLSSGTGISVDTGLCGRLIEWLEGHGEIKADFESNPQKKMD